MVLILKSEGVFLGLAHKKVEKIWDFVFTCDYGSDSVTGPKTERRIYIYLQWKNGL